jgi:urease accessory protein
MRIRTLTPTAIRMPTLTTEPLALLRLLQLVSPTLPVGAFNFSQGLEQAIELQWIRDEATASAWIAGCARHGMATLDLPMLARLHGAFAHADEHTAQRLSAELIASRETAELRAEERHLGQSLAKVLNSLGFTDAESWIRNPGCSFAAMFALAATRSGIDAELAAYGYLWTWTENQMLCAVKLIPLGQTAGQRLLESVRLQMPQIVTSALAVDDDEIGAATPLMAMASAWHETQYTRLFRS